MSSHSTSSEPRSQLTMNLDPGWEFQSSPLEENRRKPKRSSQSKIGRKPKNKRRRDSRSKIGRKQRKEKENLRSKVGRKGKNYMKGSSDRTISEQYKIVTSKQEKKGNHDLKWPSSFDCQPKSCVLVTFSPHTKQKQKRKRSKYSDPNFPTKNTIPEKVLLIHDHACNLWFYRKWFAKSSHDISMVRN